MVLDEHLLNTQHYKVQIKGKWSNSGKGVAPSLKAQFSSYWKENLLVALDYGQLTHLCNGMHENKVTKNTFKIAKEDELLRPVTAMVTQEQTKKIFFF